MSSNNSNPIEDLLNALPDKNVSIGKTADGKYFSICYTNILGTAADIKDGDFLKFDVGHGKDIFQAAEDYIKKITGRKLVFDDGESREEVTIAFIQRQRYFYYG